MAVTIKDVAALAGVNPSTVSRVIKDNPSISEKTKIKVKEAMKTLGYTQNAAAKTLASGKSGAIGVIFPPVENKQSQPFFMKILTSINEEARRQEITVAIATGHSTEDLEKQVRLMYSQSRVDGFIMLYAGPGDSIRKYLMDENIPFVLVGTPIDYQKQLTYVDNDNHLLGYEACRYLLEHNHRRLAFVTDTETGEVYKQRWLGFNKKISEENLQADLIFFDENKLELSAFSDLDGLVVMDDILALKTIQFLLSMGYKVPEDISILSFNNSVYAELVHPYLSSFDINISLLGQEAMIQLANLLEKTPQSSGEKVIVPFTLQERESVK